MCEKTRNGDLPIEFFTWYEFYMWVLVNVEDIQDQNTVYLSNSEGGLNSVFTFAYIKMKWQEEISYLGGSLEDA